MQNLLQRATPESQGVASTAILSFVEEAEKTIQSLHSFMLLRHGVVLAEGWWSPYAPDLPHMLFSLTKSFTSTAVGMAVTEGRLSVDDLVLSFFPESAPVRPSARLKAMRVRHLLSMTTGHAEDTTPVWFRKRGSDPIKGFFNRPLKYQPGTHFLYNTGASQMLAEIVEKLSGQSLLDYLTPRLFAPLGIGQPGWDVAPDGCKFGGFGLKVKTEDIARFGQLYLQKGIWNGERILPAAWVEEATTYHSCDEKNPNIDWKQGYGYQFWLCRHNAYRGDGAFGQYCLVLPEQDVVLAITSGVSDMQAVLNLVWEKLLPAFEPHPLPENAPAQGQLRQKLAFMLMPAASGDLISPQAGAITGKDLSFEPNEAKIERMSFVFNGDGTSLSVRIAGNDQRIPVGSGNWPTSHIMYRDVGPELVAVSGAWTAPDVYTFKLCWIETPFIDSFSCQFTADGVVIDRQTNLSFDQQRPLHLVGRFSETGRLSETTHFSQN